MSSANQTPATNEGRSSSDSALRSLLERAIPYEKAGAIIPRDLLQFGLLGSSMVLVTGLLALVLPGAAAIRHSSFYLVLSNWVASLDSFIGNLAGPLLILGGVLFVIDAILLRVRTSHRWRSIVIGQSIAGGVAGTACTIFLALIILNLAIWIAICVLVLLAIGMIFSVMAGG